MEFTPVSKNCIKEWLIIRIIFFVIFVAATAIVAVVDFGSDLIALKIGILIYLGIMDLFFAIYTFAFPTMQYNKYRYKIDEDRIEMKFGVIFLRHQILPFVRMQHIVIYRGILDRLFKMSTVLIFTAGTVVRIRNLSIEQADEVANSLKSILKQKEEAGTVGND